ncbi:unnamed protein product [Caenorhabditis angaria]|uniref:Uncharacterized protein n=1 Tax=Caenorhabditis angaria TaxID=860376 RepID=A0A9P1NAB3_9PELO|nr:unnamed protein product [Caenorhabditis angaria]
MSDLILTELKNNALWITLNRHKKYNAITFKMFDTLREVLLNAAEDEKVSFVVLTGGDCKMYSAGADFSPPEFAAQLEATESNMNVGYKPFVDVLAAFPKPIVALVNGPAVGVAVTTLGLMDTVIAVDTATFHMPFAEYGLCPEAMASKTLVDTMGYQKAAATMLFNEKITAQEAFIAGLVTKVIPAADFKTETAKIIERYTKLSSQTLLVGKRLMRPEGEVDKLLTANRREKEVLDKCFSSEDAVTRLSAKFSGGSKL